MNRNHSAAIIAAVCALCAVPAFAQNKAPLSAADAKYLSENAQGSIYDYSTAEAAANHAKSDEVRDYAVQLLDDHNRLNKDMLMLARERGLSLPLILQKSDEKKLKSLLKKQGAEFDKAYLMEAIKINADDVEKSQKELSLTSDEDVKKVVTNFLQTEQKHLQEARDLMAKMQAM